MGTGEHRTAKSTAKFFSNARSCLEALVSGFRPFPRQPSTAADPEGAGEQNVQYTGGVTQPSRGRGTRIAGGLLLSLAAVFLALWVGARSSDRHGALFLLGAGVFFALGGGFVWTVGYSLTMRRR